MIKVQKCEIVNHELSKNIIESVIGFNKWAEDNKRKFMSKYPNNFISEKEAETNEQGYQPEKN